MTPALPTPLLVGGGLAFGLVVGSFLNVVIHRLPRGESLVHPPSRCPHCGRGVRPWENVPVLSWLALRGRCAGCRAPISPRYPTIELLTGLLFAALAYQVGLRPMLPVWWAFAAALVAASAIDAEHRIIPDEISLGGLVFGLVGVPLVEHVEGARLGEALLRSGVGALLGGGLLWIVGFTHARISTALGRSFEHWPGDGAALPKPTELDYWVWFPGLGFGDVKLLAMIGSFLGPVGVIETIVFSSVIGLVVGLGLGVALRRWNVPFGFGPALAAGALAVVLVPHPTLVPL
ncbi:MAG TPA: prepilin peptidase [Myxococcota bacterium]|jgi:leader peptidase (prepilin peptidase)/N-methyltransferase|nr:prepilin peptidase [Myxococcota bacterium]